MTAGARRISESTAAANQQGNEMNEIIAAWQALITAWQHADGLSGMLIWLFSSAGIRALWLCIMSLMMAVVMAAACLSGLTELVADVSAWRRSRQLRKMR